jgi:hypothetical protein
MGKRSLLLAIAVCSLFVSVLSSPVAAQVSCTVEVEFSDVYSCTDLGSAPGVPFAYGGITVKFGDTNTLLVGGNANEDIGALYAVPLVRDANKHIVGFAGPAIRSIDAAFNDGGVGYGPGHTLFLARWPVNELGQTKLGSTITDKIIDLSAFGVGHGLPNESPGGVTLVPSGYGGAGHVKLNTWPSGFWYDATISPDGAGTFNIDSVTEAPASQLPQGPEGFIFVPKLSPHFPNQSILLSEFGASEAEPGGNVVAYEIDANGDPNVASRRLFITGLTGAEGAHVDPVTGDFIFTTFGVEGGDHIVVVQGFIVDFKAPKCVVTGRGPDFINLQIRDLESGLDSIQISNKKNANVVVDPFEPRTRDPVNVTATRIDPAKKGSFSLIAQDFAGNKGGCTATGQISF